MPGLNLHEARHSYASWLIDAKLNLKQISTYMGHASIKITLDRYGHLLSDDAERVADKLDAYLARAASR
jgi:integrase